MALKCFGYNNRLLFNFNPRLIFPLQQNGMSQYPEFFINPIYRKESQDKIYNKKEEQNYAHIPTKAANVDQTCALSHDPVISLFVNYVMRCGKKALARQLVEKSFENIKRIQLEKYHKTNDSDKDKIELNPKIVFHKAVENTKPILQLTPIKRGGVRYQVPVPITNKRSQFLSMKWLIEAAKDKERTKHFPDTLAYELIDAANNGGKAVKRKQDLHKQCEANRAFAHYRWS